MQNTIETLAKEIAAVKAATPIGAGSSRQKLQYPNELKVRVVGACRQQKESMVRIARRLGVSTSALRSWIDEQKKEQFVAVSITPDPQTQRETRRADEGRPLEIKLSVQSWTIPVSRELTPHELKALLSLPGGGASC